MEHQSNVIVGCTLEQAKAIVELRPFSDESSLREKLGQGKKKAGPAGISPRMFDDSAVVFGGYGIVDRIVTKCEEIGEKLKQEISKWTGSSPSKGKGKEGDVSARATPDGDDGALSLRSRDVLASTMPKYYISSQPASLSSDVQLKEYQLVGINWLNLLYREGHNCILADEMGKPCPFTIVRRSCRRVCRARKDRSGHRLLRTPERSGFPRPSPHCGPVCHRLARSFAPRLTSGIHQDHLP